MDIQDCGLGALDMSPMECADRRKTLNGTRGSAYAKRASPQSSKFFSGNDLIPPGANADVRDRCLDERLDPVEVFSRGGRKLIQ